MYNPALKRDGRYRARHLALRYVTNNGEDVCRN